MRALQMPKLTEEQQQQLVEVYRSTKEARIRTRAQMGVTRLGRREHTPRQ